VISSDLPALRELVSPGDRGMVFRPSDPVAMASVIEGLVNDLGERDRLASAGSAWVREHRTVESNARRYEALLRPLVS
jgi:glycosyltransferase involved in cell wall biosynthesis